MQLTIDIYSIDHEALAPKPHTLPGGKQLLVFPDDNTEVTKVDFIFEAGSAYQSKLLQAGAASQLAGICTPHHDVQQIAEFIDGIGVAVDRDMDLLGSTLSVYFLPKYASELFPLLHEMLTETVFPRHEFDIYLSKRRMQLLSNLHRTDYVARNLFYRALYGDKHPFGSYAMPADVDRLSLQDVEEYYQARYSLQDAVLQLAGYVDGPLLDLYDSCFGGTDPHGNLGCNNAGTEVTLPDIRGTLSWEDLAPSSRPAVRTRRRIEGTVQSTIRIGRLLPWRWDDPRYTDFMVLNTLLGGYFGSRLMSNIRENKGYTYGIYSQADVLRGSTIFYITADVNGAATEEAVKEIYRELQRLCDEPVDDKELEIVKNYMVGDFMRSIDGIFERSDRWRMRQMTSATQLFDQHYCDSIVSVTPGRLLETAQQVLLPGELTEVVAGDVCEDAGHAGKEPC